MSRPLRVGLVGCGRLAEVGYAPALQAAAGVACVAVADRDPSRRDRVAAQLGDVPAFVDATALLGAVPVDGLVVATPAGAHVADATAAAALGVPALVEKPPAVDLAGARRLAGLRPPPRIAFNRRFQPGPARLRAVVPPDGAVLVDLEIRYRRAGWRAHTVGDDALLDLGPHLIDLARWITGAEVTHVRGAVVTPQRAAFDLLLGAGRARVRCVTDRPHTERIEVRDRRGALLAAHRAGGLVAAVAGRLRPGGPHPLTASLTAQLEAYARALDGACEPVLGRAGDGVAVMAAVDAVRSCAVAGGALTPVAGLATDRSTDDATEGRPC